MKKEGENMTERIINNINIPPHIEKEIGLSKDWKKNVSPGAINSIIRSAERFKEALKRLSKN